MDFLIRSYVMWLVLCFGLVLYFVSQPFFWMAVGAGAVLVVQSLVRKDD